MSNTYIFIDGSYFCFYRYYSLMTWWRNAYPETPLENPIENEDFVNKYRSTFIDNVEQIGKKLKIVTKKSPTLPTIYVGKDCPPLIYGDNQFIQNIRQQEIRMMDF